MTPALEIRRLSKRYGQTVAVDDVSFSIGGGVFGLLGANGAGKSTLLKCVLGLVEPTAGEIFVGGAGVAREPLAVRRRIGYSPEELTLYDRLTGQEFLELVAGLKDLEARDEIDEAFAYFGLSGRRNELVGGYSLGMRKKIGLIAALLGSPPLLLLDEPLNGLDAASMRLLRLRLEERVAAGATVVLSSHVMAFVERICSRVLILRDGRIATEGTPSELRSQAGLPDAPFDDVFLHFAL